MTTLSDIALLTRRIAPGILSAHLMEKQFKVTIPVACPECKADSVILQLLTSYGSYCRCEACGHLWHHDKPMNQERKKSATA